MIVNQLTQLILAFCFVVASVTAVKSECLKAQYGACVEELPPTGSRYIHCDNKMKAHCHDELVVRLNICNLGTSNNLPSCKDNAKDYGRLCMSNACDIDDGPSYVVPRRPYNDSQPTRPP